MLTALVLSLLGNLDCEARDARAAAKPTRGIIEREVHRRIARVVGGFCWFSSSRLLKLFTEAHASI